MFVAFLYSLSICTTRSLFNLGFASRLFYKRACTTWLFHKLAFLTPQLSYKLTCATQFILQTCLLSCYFTNVFAQLNYPRQTCFFCKLAYMYATQLFYKFACAAELFYKLACGTQLSFKFACEAQLFYKVACVYVTQLHIFYNLACTT